MQEVKENSKKRLIKEFGNIISSYRKNTGKSIYAISAECGLSKSTWRDVEKGIGKDVKFTTIWQLAEGLNIPLEDLIKDLKLKLGKDFLLFDD